LSIRNKHRLRFWI